MKVQTYTVDDLKPHPLSAQLFRDLDDGAMSDLKKDIQKRGLQHMIEVDINGLVICGSQRLRAIRELGWRTVDGQLRDDLQSQEEIEEHLIRDNTERRHLSAMERYQAAKHLESLYLQESQRGRRTDLETETSSSEELEEGKTQARDRAAKEMGMSGSTMHRLGKIAESDREDIKTAVDKGEMSVSAGHEALRHKAPKEEGHSDTLKFLQFKRTVEKFEKFIASHPKNKYNGYANDIEKLLDHLTTTLHEWKEPLSE